MSDRQGILAIVNPVAGSTADPAVGAALSLLEASTDVVVVRPADPAECRSALVRHRDRRPVICGGDGTLHTVVALLYELGWLDRTVAGLVPLGTGNDFARTLGIPLDAVRAARVVLDGRPRDLELLVDDTGGVVVNAVHVGVGADAALRAKRWKSRLGLAAYRLGAAVAGLTRRGWRLRVEADGLVLVDVDRRVLMVGIAVGQTIGGGTKLAPRAVADDGLAEVIVSEATGPVARLGYALHLRRGEHGSRDDVYTIRARTVTISGEPFPVNADGELSGPVCRRTWTMRHAAWRVTVPS